MVTVLMGVRWSPVGLLVCISRVVSDAERLLVGLLAMCICTFRMLVGAEWLSPEGCFQSTAQHQFVDPDDWVRDPTLL